MKWLGIFKKTSYLAILVSVNYTSLALVLLWFTKRPYSNTYLCDHELCYVVSRLNKLGEIDHRWLTIIRDSWLWEMVFFFFSALGRAPKVYLRELFLGSSGIWKRSIGILNRLKNNFETLKRKTIVMYLSCPSVSCWHAVLNIADTQVDRCWNEVSFSKFLFQVFLWCIW